MILYCVPISIKYEAFSIKKKKRNGPFPEEEEVYLTTTYMKRMPYFTQTQGNAN